MFDEEKEKSKICEILYRTINILSNGDIALCEMEETTCSRSAQMELLKLGCAGGLKYFC